MGIGEAQPAKNSNLWLLGNPAEKHFPIHTLASKWWVAVQASTLMKVPWVPKSKSPLSCMICRRSSRKHKLSSILHETHTHTHTIVPVETTWTAWTSIMRHKWWVPLPLPAGLRYRRNARKSVAVWLMVQVSMWLSCTVLLGALSGTVSV
jgi:hypothetical protein